jgi:uncharacterized protein YggT (Ycf19 family)
MSDSVIPPDEPERAAERAAERVRDAEQRERQSARVPLDTERQLPGDTALADRAAPTLETDPLERITAERRRVRVISEAEREREAGRLRGVAVARQLVNVVFFVVYALLGVRLTLGVLGANLASPFARWVAAASEPLHAPFRGVFPNVTIEDGFTFALSVAFAILVYALLHALVHALLRLIAIARRAF